MARVQDPKTGKFVRTKPDYKAMYEQAKTEMEDMVDHDSFKDIVEKYAFLYAHAPFWLKWLYNRKFKKGE